MFLSEAEAEAALRMLRRQRDALDRQIADHQLYLELGRRLTVAEAAPSPPEPRPAAIPVPDPLDGASFAADAAPLDDLVAARRHGRALVTASLELLHEAGRPLHAGEILQGLVRLGLTVPGHDPVAALNTRLWKRSGPGGPLRRLGDAVYAPAEGEEDA